MMYSYEHLLSHPDNPTLVPHKSLFQSQLEISLKATGMDKLHYTREGPAISISELGRGRLHAQKMECIVWLSHHTAWSLACRKELKLRQRPTDCGIQRKTPCSLAETTYCTDMHIAANHPNKSHALHGHQFQSQAF